MIVITSRFSGVKYFCATRCTSAAVMFMKMSNSPSAVLMSLWITRRAPSCPRLVLVRLAAEDVVARELVLRLLQLAAAIGSVSCSRRKTSSRATISWGASRTPTRPGRWRTHS